jgi:ribosomal protection tetracycline resistance protein
VDTSAAVLKALAGLRAVPQSTAVHSPSYHLDGEIPAARVHDLHRQLPALTRGEGALDSTFDHYQQVRGETPTRPRTDHNPLNREEYLLHVQRRVQRLS